MYIHVSGTIRRILIVQKLSPQVGGTSTMKNGVCFSSDGSSVTVLFGIAKFEILSGIGCPRAARFLTFRCNPRARVSLFLDCRTHQFRSDRRLISSRLNGRRDAFPETFPAYVIMMN